MKASDAEGESGRTSVHQFHSHLFNWRTDACYQPGRVLTSLSH